MAARIASHAAAVFRTSRPRMASASTEVISPTRQMSVCTTESGAAVHTDVHDDHRGDIRGQRPVGLRAVGGHRVRGGLQGGDPCALIDYAATGFASRLRHRSPRGGSPPPARGQPRATLSRLTPRSGRREHGRVREPAMASRNLETLAVQRKRSRRSAFGGHLSYDAGWFVT